MICSLHEVQSVWKEGVSKKTNKPYAFWGCDIKTDGKYCTAEQIEEVKTPEPPKTVEPTREPVDPWIDAKKKESESMMRMAAQKNAAMVVAAYLERPDTTVPAESTSVTDLLLKVSDRNLLWLKGSIISTTQTSASPSKTSDGDDGEG